MEITINTEKDYRPQSNKTESSKMPTIISATIVGILVLCAIGYAIYNWKNKPDTLFHPEENKTIRQLLADAKHVKQEKIQDKGEKPKAERIYERLKKTCKAKKLLDDKGNILAGDKDLPEDIKTALQEGQAAEKAIKKFQDLKEASRKSKAGPIAKGAFHNYVHTIIGTSADKQAEAPTDEQIEAAHKKLTEKLKQAQNKWNKGKTDNMSYAAQHDRFYLVAEYKRIKEILENAKKSK